MPGTDSGKRRYDSLRRAAQARQTRSDIADAARRLFVAHGWAATTIRAVAQEAGVSVPTVYAAYGDKAGLVRALVESADLAADGLLQVSELESADPAGQLAAMAAYDRRLFERGGDLIALIREVARTEPALASAYVEGRRRGDETREQVFSSWPAGVLRSGLEVPAAVDIYAAICNVDVYNTLLTERGWTPDQVEAWWSGVLVRELLAR